MDDKIFDQIHDVDLKKTMESSYIDYAMSVIAQRALPDVRDGLKPVQRRVLELNNGPDKPHRKCARIVGDTMGKYHPHGDSSIYGALVNMAQDWSFRYPLVDGHGNFGSVDGDGAGTHIGQDLEVAGANVLNALGKAAGSSIHITLHRRQRSVGPAARGDQLGLVAFGFLLEDQAKAAGKGTAGIRGGDGEGTGLHGSNQIFKSLIR